MLRSSNQAARRAMSVGNCILDVPVRKSVSDQEHRRDLIGKLVVQLTDRLVLRHQHDRVGGYGEFSIASCLQGPYDTLARLGLHDGMAVANAGISPTTK